MNVGLQDDIPPPPTTRPRTATVAGVLLGAALLVSWLAAYALPNALVAAELMNPWPQGGDPRPRWLAIGFILLAGLFTTLMFLFRWISRRQLQSMDDEMTDADEEESTSAFT